jgi:hypothetical protein
VEGLGGRGSTRPCISALSTFRVRSWISRSISPRLGKQQPLRKSSPSGQQHRIEIIGNAPFPQTAHSTCLLRSGSVTQMNEGRRGREYLCGSDTDSIGSTDWEMQNSRMRSSPPVCAGPKAGCARSAHARPEMGKQSNTGSAECDRAVKQNRAGPIVPSRRIVRQRTGERTCNGLSANHLRSLGTCAIMIKPFGTVVAFLKDGRLVASPRPSSRQVRFSSHSHPSPTWHGVRLICESQPDLVPTLLLYPLFIQHQPAERVSVPDTFSAGPLSSTGGNRWWRSLCVSRRNAIH